MLKVALLLEGHVANRLRVQAYRRAGLTLEDLERPVSHIVQQPGTNGLTALSGRHTGLFGDLVRRTREKRRGVHGRLFCVGNTGAGRGLYGGVTALERLLERRGHRDPSR